ncbi:DUF2284 domain-containing protein [Desulfonema magnum]|uniref:DUF2284 n=1 Tax=Desulfonema magnum TaxID=45655 RepID=A0A975BG63_9BACT|nr:DUF2284 domain-containing protein [Desulfonema magnum]QTA84698.1 DUF2284 [Desulfonema magnum]
MSLSDYLKCPGPDQATAAVPETYLCPDCGKEVEIWTDEKKQRCPDCRAVIRNKNFQLSDEEKNNSLLRQDKADRNLKKLVHLAYQRGASGAQIISPDDISAEENLANFCREPRCENYGLSPSCPPHVSGPPGFRELQKKMSHAIVIRIDVPSAVLFSAERGEVMKLLHEIVAGLEQEAVNMGYSASKSFAGGSCKKIFCHDHAVCGLLSDRGQCRNPQHARPSMSGFGINVSELMQTAGWPGDINIRNTDSDTASMTWIAGLVMIG